jgi:hypothetical protein
MTTIETSETSADPSKHAWQPVAGARSTYRCTVCYKVVMRKFGRFTARRSSTEWNEACSGPPKPIVPVVVRPLEPDEPPPWSPDMVDDKRRPLAPRVGAMPLGRQDLYELLLVYLGRREKSYTWTTGNHFLWVLEQIGLVTRKVALKMPKDQLMQSLIIRHATRVVAAATDAKVTYAATSPLVIRASSANSTDFERARVLTTYALIITTKGVEIADKVAAKFSKIPFRDIQRWEEAWHQWHRLTGKVRAAAANDRKMEEETRDDDSPDV